MSEKVENYFKYIEARNLWRVYQFLPIRDKLRTGVVNKDTVKMIQREFNTQVTKYIYNFRT